VPLCINKTLFLNFIFILGRGPYGQAGQFWGAKKLGIQPQKKLNFVVAFNDTIVCDDEQ
jgi:hypothetical protein